MAKFLQAALISVDNETITKLTKGSSIEERIGTSDSNCPVCGHEEWWLLPINSAAVRESGKRYCECLNCGYTTHL